MENNKIDRLLGKSDRPFLYVDFNEFLSSDRYLISRFNIKKDIYGREIEIYEGVEVIAYCEDLDENDKRDDLFFEGICTRNDTELWSDVNWLVQVNEKGVRWVSDVGEEL